MAVANGHLPENRTGHELKIKPGRLDDPLSSGQVRALRSGRVRSERRAGWTGEAGDAAAARDQFAALLADRERILGTDHPDTLAARSDLARTIGNAGDAAAARDQYAALLADRERILGTDHPDTLAARSDLTYWTEKADGGSGPSAATSL
jgi:hypothetical protein